MRKLMLMLMLTVMSFGAISTSTFALPAPQQKHLKKDGTPDKRFKENKVHLKKDGTPDKRYKENKNKH